MRVGDWIWVNRERREGFQAAYKQACMACGLAEGTHWSLGYSDCVGEEMLGAGM